jgi:protein-S-isoprenylcysteine O-methyltransferase Ste14
MCFFSQISLNSQKHIDLAHWFNLIGAVLLFSFNFVFPKNKLNTVASVLTSLGVIAHISLCTIDFIMWSYGNDDIGSNKLREQISNTPLILYPFVIIGPSLLFVGLATHALNFIKKNPISSLMVIIGGPFVGLSYFIWSNGILMLISCVVFASGLALLLLRKEEKTIELENDNPRT